MIFGRKLKKFRYKPDVEEIELKLSAEEANLISEALQICGIEEAYTLGCELADDITETEDV